MRRRLHDQRLEWLRELTGVRRTDELLELGRIADEVVERPAGEAVLADWIGRSYAVGVVSGTVARAQSGRVQRSGDVFLTAPYERIESLGAVAIITTPVHAERLDALLELGRRTGRKRQEATPAMSSSAAAYGSS